MLKSQTDDDSDYEEDDDEVQSILRQEQIEQLAHAIRMVIVGMLEIQSEPYPYVFKKWISTIRESHECLLNADVGLYEDAVQCARNEMFSEDPILKKSPNAQDLFLLYTKDPAKFDFMTLIEHADEKYREQIEPLF